MKPKDCFAIIYILVAIFTVGWAAADPHPYCQGIQDHSKYCERYDTPSLIITPLLGAFWPIYWSAKFAETQRLP